MSGRQYTVVDDPGHNHGSRNMSPCQTLKEFEFAQSVADKCTIIYDRIPEIAQVKTKELMTHPTSLAMRRDAAVNAKAHLFNSHHSNAFGTGGWASPRGFGVYVYPGRDLDLAAIALGWCEKLLPIPSRGIRERNLYVLRETPMPSVIFEWAFHTNKEDVEYLKCEEFRWLCAEVSARTSCEFFGVSYPEREENVLSAKFHTIVKGDSLRKIAQDNGLTVVQLMELNPHIQNRNEIYAEHGGDMVFLEEPNPFEVSYARMKRSLILCRIGSVTERKLERLKAIIKEQEEMIKKAVAREADAVAMSNEYKAWLKSIYDIAGKICRQ